MLKKLWIIVIVSCLYISVVDAKARFMSIEKLVATSDIIAVIEVIKTEQLGKMFDQNLPKKGFWKYGQKNIFRFEKMIKNNGFIAFNTKKPQMLYAQKSFICAKASYKPGKYLVFFESVGLNEWITINHQFGGLRIDSNSNVLSFGWYLKERDFKAKIKLKKAIQMIEDIKLDSKPIYLSVNIPSNLMYNKWNVKNNSQKLFFHVYTPPKQNWPNGLTNFVRAYFKKGAVKKADYNLIIKSGGKYNIKAIWTNGYLVIDSIKPFEGNS